MGCLIRLSFLSNMDPKISVSRREVDVRDNFLISIQILSIKDRTYVDDVNIKSNTIPLILASSYTTVLQASTDLPSRHARLQLLYDSSRSRYCLPLIPNYFGLNQDSAPAFIILMLPGSSYRSGVKDMSPESVRVGGHAWRFFETFL